MQEHEERYFSERKILTNEIANAVENYIRGGEEQANAIKELQKYYSWDEQITASYDFEVCIANLTGSLNYYDRDEARENFTEEPDYSDIDWDDDVMSNGYVSLDEFVVEINDLQLTYPSVLAREKLLQQQEEDAKLVAEAEKEREKKKLANTIKQAKEAGFSTQELASLINAG